MRAQRVKGMRGMRAQLRAVGRLVHLTRSAWRGHARHWYASAILNYTTTTANSVSPSGVTLFVACCCYGTSMQGAGEVLLNCIDKDGTNSGFDIGLVNAMKAAVTIPVIASSGAGSAQHFVECFEKTPVEAALAVRLGEWRSLLPSALQRSASYVSYRSPFLTAVDRSTNALPVPCAMRCAVLCCAGRDFPQAGGPYQRGESDPCGEQCPAALGRPAVERCQSSASCSFAHHCQQRQQQRPGRK
jgi:hypothetical protein